MARRSRKRPRNESLNGQEAQQQPAEINAFETESTQPPKDPQLQMLVDDKELKKIQDDKEGNEPNQSHRNEPDSDSTQAKDSEHHVLTPIDSNTVLVPESEPFVVVKNETNGLSTEPDSTTTPKKKKRKRKGKSLLINEGGAETSDVKSEHREVITDLGLLSPKDSEIVLLLPEPEPVAEKNNTSEICIEPESTPSRKKRKRKGKSLSTSEGTGTKHCELIPNLDLLSHNDFSQNQSHLLPESEPVAEKKEETNKSEPVAERKEANKSEPVAEKKEEANTLLTEPESVTPKKKKRKGKGKGKKVPTTTSEGIETKVVNSEQRLDPLNMCTSEGAETKVVNSEQHEVIPNLDSLNMCTSEGAETNIVNSEQRELIPNLDPLNMSTSEGAETNVVNSEQHEVIPNLDPLTPKDLDSGSVLLPQAESFAEKNDTNQLCTQPELVTPRKKRKGKRKSLSKSEGVEINHVDSEHRELCFNLAALPPKDADPLLLPEPAPVGEKNEANQLCTKPDSTSPKFEGAEIKDMGSENVDLCPKLDPLPHNDPDPLLLAESEPAPTEWVGQKKKRKKKKNKGELEGEGVESNRPSDEHSQQCNKARPTRQEARNQRNRKRQVMDDTHDSSVQSMVTPLERAPRISGHPLKHYERYERCLECRQICRGDRTCSGRKYLSRNRQICFFCGTPGHLLGMCPMSPGAKCANGIIMLDDYVRKKCGKKSETMPQKVSPANVPTYAPMYTPFMPNNIQPYPAPFVRPRYAPSVVWRN